MTLEEFLSYKAPVLNPIKMVICTVEIATQIKAKVTDRVLENEKDSSVLANLDAKPGYLLIITDEVLMRGFDYRAPTNGIELLLARDFACERHLVQALGRVGRHYDPCRRFRLTGLTPVNAA